MSNGRDRRSVRRLLIQAVLLGCTLSDTSTGAADDLAKPPRAESRAETQGEAAAARRALPPTPAPIKGILTARRFTLATPFLYTWSQEQITVKSGLLVVLAVDPAYVLARDTLEPVLYVGDIAAQRLNHGDKSGRVLALVPGDVNLATTPIWFGSPELPERVTAARAMAERAMAERAGVHALRRMPIAGLDRPAIAASDLAALLRKEGADLLLQYSPQEKSLADAWRLPIAKAPPSKQSR